MRKLFMVLVLFVAGCTEANSHNESKQSYEERDANELLKSSVVLCSDGNQIRFITYSLGSNASAFTAWTIVDPEGRPKRCVVRQKQTAQYEEVPQ